MNTAPFGLFLILNCRKRDYIASDVKANVKKVSKKGKLFAQKQIRLSMSPRSAYFP